ncbi:GlxA family transcriptional regulator [Shinella sp. CPCC 100929]|uniref:GlxA family transcriptional regulator n=1 Tax=Shinella lacus TaxID=2654216 RepID=A0ABT1R5P1_9HYPH|nr:GlxA family transcriptional regulator [Shinella lacus]
MLRIGFVLSPDFQMMSLAAASAFEFANLTAGETLYSIDFLSAEGGPLATSLGNTIDTQPIGTPGHDTLIFGTGVDLEPTPPALVAFAREAFHTTRRVAAICVGAFVLAEAGLLDGRRATTHWLAARKLQAAYPQIRVEEDRIFIIDGSIWTSAGMSAGIDMALGMIEKDFGADLAQSVAQRLVLYHRRGGGQSQHSELLALTPKSDRIQTALTYARSNLRSALSVEELAEVAHLSPRQFSRAFRAETGQTPAKAVENLRLEAARMMMAQSRHPVDVVASETGFADRERMRRAFVRTFGQPPQAIRRNARGAMAEDIPG